MSSSVPDPARPNSSLVSHLWWILLLAALALLWLATERRIDRVNAITESPTWSVDAPERDASSPTGYALGQRRLITPGHHSPSFAWIMEAQKSVEQGAWRIRHIDYDAAPDGRDIKRTAPYRWWLISVGWLYGTIQGEPLGYSIERGTLIADPILLALMLVLGAVYSARYIGTFAAIGFILGGICLFPLSANFQPGAPDPHSLAWLLALGSVLPLLNSAEKTGDRRRVHFVAAGVIGGLGFWNNATSQAPLLLAVFLGAVGYEFVRSRGNDPAPAASSHWRAWALAGAATTLAASLFEFAPDHLSWSLDAVNPLHAVIWWGMGEMARAAGTWFRQGNQSFNWRSAVLLGLAGVAIACWPVVGVLSESGSLLASDSYARELANHHSGGSELSLGVWLSNADIGPKLALLLPCGLLFALAVRFFLGNRASEGRGRLVFIAIPAIVALALACLQLRWWNLFDVLALLALTMLFAESDARDFATRAKAFGLLLLLLPGLFVGFPAAIKSGVAADISEMETRALIARDFSYWLNKRAGTEPNVLFSAPLFSGAAAYYGGFDVVISNDGENKAGFSTAVRLASSSSARELPILIESTGITHIALPLWDSIMDHFARLGRGVPGNQPPPPEAFSVSLKNYSLPNWMRPMNYAVSSEEQFRGYALNAYEVAKEEETDVAMSRLADFFVERRQLGAMRSIREALLKFPRSVHAKAAIANIDLNLGDQAAFEQSLQDLIPTLSRRSARDLPAYRRISLGFLLIQAKQIELAREQISRCLETLDVETLRSLTPIATARLIALSRALEIPFPNQELEATALELIPPKIRASL
ncbi:hypothetical protein [Pelagicoccus sp. SDUM812003]|uniref:hypothetical protein n=1 Tax=Pelagicoccus sp. SDUM812003 TaxID=3041267 RepID=UPI00280DF8F2|nr:hypothetical protein [Pelagicoccus sp. SDUM812003]MDQ8205391.1 hypothetical protein [Pelagicoccus sp. SDUM812003]